MDRRHLGLRVSHRMIFHLASFARKVHSFAPVRVGGWLFSALMLRASAPQKAGHLLGRFSRLIYGHECGSGEMESY